MLTHARLQPSEPLHPGAAPAPACFASKHMRLPQHPRGWLHLCGMACNIDMICIVIDDACGLLIRMSLASAGRASSLLMKGAARLTWGSA